MSMRMIEIAPLPNGAHRNQSASFPIPSGWAIVPDTLDTSNFPFGDVTVSDGIVTEWIPLPIPQPSPVPNSEKRKAAYETGEVDGVSYRVTWNAEQYTTDALTQLGMRYQFREETETAEAIQTIVEAGVNAIREAFPDESREENE